MILHWIKKKLVTRVFIRKWFRVCIRTNLLFLLNHSTVLFAFEKKQIVCKFSFFALVLALNPLYVLKSWIIFYLGFVFWLSILNIYSFFLLLFAAITKLFYCFIHIPVFVLWTKVYMIPEKNELKICTKIASVFYTS